MAKVVRPLRFDPARKARRNETRRNWARRKAAERKRLTVAINSMFWFGIEPESMWVIDLPTNDNRERTRRT